MPLKTAACASKNGRIYETIASATKIWPHMRLISVAYVLKNCLICETYTSAIMTRLLMRKLLFYFRIGGFFAYVSSFRPQFTKFSHMRPQPILQIIFATEKVAYFPLMRSCVFNSLCLGAFFGK